MEKMIIEKDFMDKYVPEYLDPIKFHLTLLSAKINMKIIRLKNENLSYNEIFSKIKPDLELLLNINNKQDA